MLKLYQLFVDRLKALFLAEVGLELEAEFATRDAARKADLFRQANQYQEEGLTDVAEDLRQSAKEARPDQPLARAVLITDHLLRIPITTTCGDPHADPVQVNEAISGSGEEAKESVASTEQNSTAKPHRKSGTNKK